MPVWSAVTVMGMKLKDINNKIGTRHDPEGWYELHNKVINSTDELIKKKDYCNWGPGICTTEIVDAIVRNTCVCITVSTFVKVNISINLFFHNLYYYFKFIFHLNFRAVNMVMKKIFSCHCLV